MDENGIKKAIEKGKLPTSTFEKLFFGLFFLACLYNGEMFYLNGSIFMLFILAVMTAFWIWGFQRVKKLTPYISNIPTIRKALVLYNLADGPDVYDVEKKNNSYGIYFKAGWFVYPYKATILYDECGYYIASYSQISNIIPGFIVTNSAGIPINKTKQVIEKIKKLEAEV